jgi:hypothetical protein
MVSEKQYLRFVEKNKQAKASIKHGKGIGTYVQKRGQKRPGQKLNKERHTKKRRLSSMSLAEQNQTASADTN